MRPGSIVCSLVLIAGCTATDLASSDHAIIGGTRSTGTTSTVMLVGYPPDRSVIHTCTAVLVSPTVLLTAAHCIDAPTHPNYLYGVFTGDDATAYPFLVDLEPHLEPVASVHPHPDYVTTLPFFADLGTVVLETALPIAPIEMQRTTIDQSIVGKQALIVGYGQTTYNQFNSARHEALTTVSAVDNDTIVIGDTVKRSCLGDSGGPAIVENKLVGIDSYGPTGCGNAAHYRRVDFFLPFIDVYVPPPSGGPDAGVGPTPDAGSDDPGESGGCATSNGAGLGLAASLLALFAARRRLATRSAARR